MLLEMLRNQIQPQVFKIVQGCFSSDSTMTTTPSRRLDMGGGGQKNKHLHIFPRNPKDLGRTEIRPSLCVYALEAKDLLLLGFLVVHFFPLFSVERQNGDRMPSFEQRNYRHWISIEFGV
jgi:hypothetical protein